MTFLLLRRQKVSVQHFNTSTTRLAESGVFLAQDNLVRIISISRESLNRNDLCTVAQQKNGSRCVPEVRSKNCFGFSSSLTAGYPCTSQLVVISAGFLSKQAHFSNVFLDEIGP